MRNHNLILFFAMLMLFSCGDVGGRKAENAGPTPVGEQLPRGAPKVRPMPEEGQVLRDARAVVARSAPDLLRRGYAPTLSMGQVTMDPYEKDLCVATVEYHLGSLTGTIAVSYRWAGDFWTCTGGRDLGMR